MEPTRITKETATCIDLIFNNIHDTNQYLEIDVKELGLSDHMGITITLPTKSPPCEQTWYIYERILSEQNIKKFKAILKDINWSNFMSEDKSINDNYNAFHKIITDIMEQIFPKTKIKLKRHKKKYMAN